MPTNPKVTKAFRAMKSLGISEVKVKPVLKRLLKLYDKNWELIEEENYRALADAIFEDEESKEPEPNGVQSAAPLENAHEEAEVNEEPERPLKRLRRHKDGQSSNSEILSNSNLTGASLIKPKEEPSELPESSPQTQNDSRGLGEFPQSNSTNSKVESMSVTCQAIGRNKGKGPVSPKSPKSLTLQGRSEPSQPGNDDVSQPTITRTNYANSISHSMRLRDRGKQPVRPQNGLGERRLDPQRSSKAVRLKEKSVEPGVLPEPEEHIPDSVTLVKPKEEPLTDDLPREEIPIAIIHPEPSYENCSADTPRPALLAITERGADNDVPASASETRANGALVKDTAEFLEVASSPCGKVKISLTFDLASGTPEFCMPRLDSVVEAVTDKYRVLHPDLSVTMLMEDMCTSFLKLVTHSSCSRNGSLDTGSELEKPLSVVIPIPAKCSGKDDCGQASKNLSLDKREIAEENEQDHGEQSDPMNLLAKSQPCPDDTCEIGVENEPDDVEQTDAENLLAKTQPSPVRIGSLIDVIDIAKGQERVIISLVNEVNKELPPSFFYIPQNAIFQNAYMSFSLARIGDNNCCSACSGDCLSLSTPCACAHEMGGDYAYTKEGLVKEEFLKECVSMNRDPEKHCQFFCKECPLERSKSEGNNEPCKGHLVRKFIKECWWKCGCNKECGNRVVQRGINRRLQVFMTPGGKGWGLRTLEDLPKGAFVCEYVGEVLTNAELFDRVSRSPKGEKHSYPVLLDADWCSEGVLKDEEALCLDATHYGNVARFINHRCFDSNLVEIPVEVETPDHHYYHLAFFTTRKVKAMEELTWDYGIDFDDIDHPVKAFRCQCGSKYCRNIKRSRRSRSSRR